MTRRFRISAGLRVPAAFWLAGALAAAAQFQAGQTISGFRLPGYDREGTLQSLLRGEHARALDESRIEITGLLLEMFRAGAVETRVTSPFCVYDRQSGSAHSTSSVRIVRQNMVITGERFSWDTDSQRFLIETNTRVVVQGVPGAVQAPGGRAP